MRQNVTFAWVGLPELTQRLDKISQQLSDPIAREALKAGGTVIQKAAQSKVPRLTGALEEDIVVVTRIREQGTAKYVLIGPGWDPNNYRRVQSRSATNRQARPDQTTNPGIYGYFVEAGHRSPGRGLRNIPEYRRDARLAKKQNKKLDSRGYGTITTPAYPWLGPAFEESKDQAFETMADVIRRRLESLSLNP